MFVLGPKEKVGNSPSIITFLFVFYTFFLLLSLFTIRLVYGSSFFIFLFRSSNGRNNRKDKVLVQDAADFIGTGNESSLKDLTLLREMGRVPQHVSKIISQSIFFFFFASGCNINVYSIRCPGQFTISSIWFDVESPTVMLSNISSS